MFKRLKNSSYCSTRFPLGIPEYTSMAYNGEMMILGESDGPFKVHMIDSRIMSQKSAHSDAIFVVVFNHDGTLFATGSRDNSAKVWEISRDGQTIECVATLDASKYGVTSLAFNCDSTFLVAGGSSDEDASVWGISRDSDGLFVVRHIMNITGDPNNYVYSIACHPTDPNIVATGFGDGSIKLFGLFRCRFTCMNILSGHASSVSSLTFLQDGTGLVSGSNDGTVKIWRDMHDTPRLVETIGTPNKDNCSYDAAIRVNTMALDRTTDTIAIGKSNRVIEFWKLSSDGGASSLTKTISRPDEEILSVGFSEGTFFSLGDKLIQLE
jgi:WD40 repeat protein